MRSPFRKLSGTTALSATRVAFAVGVTLIGFSLGVFAQEAADLEEAASQRSARLSEAVVLALADRSSEAEATLNASLRNSADSARGQLELGSLFVRVAVECAANGKTAAADSYASGALERFASARKLATDHDAGVAASAWRQEGFVQLEFCGDDEAALAAYRNAEALAPDDTQLRIKLDLLEKRRAARDETAAEVTP